MKAVRVHQRSTPPQIVVEDTEPPEPGAGEVLVRVHASALTPSELDWVPTWTTPDGGPRPMPVIPGHELSGEVVRVGDGVTDLEPGDAVYGFNDWYRDGTQAELCIARPGELAAKPRSIDHVAAATVPISALTAWQGLIERGRLAAGEHVLVHGASGGVGLFAVQLARSRGARVTGTASTANLDFVRGFGADAVIDYRRDRFEEHVRDVDLVLDTVGGETLERSWDVLAPGGRVVTIATSSEQTTSPRVRDAFFIVEARRDQLAEITRLIDDGTLHTVVGGVFPLADAAAAYAFKPPRGKVVLRVVP